MLMAYYDTRLARTSNISKLSDPDAGGLVFWNKQRDSYPLLYQLAQNTVSAPTSADHDLIYSSAIVKRCASQLVMRDSEDIPIISCIYSGSRNTVGPTRIVWAYIT